MYRAWLLVGHAPLSVLSTTILHALACSAFILQFVLGTVSCYTSAIGVVHRLTGFRLPRITPASAPSVKSLGVFSVTTRAPEWVGKTQAASHWQAPRLTACLTSVVSPRSSSRCGAWPFYLVVSPSADILVIVIGVLLPGP